jgi:non-specific serine/threonine protein kinase
VTTLAADLQRSFADGVWLAELSALRNAELLARTVAASLGLPDEAAGDPVDLLADHLAERHLLLILDTCEHLVDACAKLAEALLLTAPGCGSWRPAGSRSVSGASRRS